ncbi:S9 family peptidase [SAR86 cluster bacterium]|nr:S9 family peptidase [SAR86 cluster bacterium]
MIKYLLTFLLIFTTLLFTSENKIETLKDLKPSPKKLPVTFEAHGVKRVDNYYWMRDDSRKDPEIIAHLNEENSYLENWFVSGNDNRKALFEEITDRIPKNEDSVPVRLKNYEYFRRYKQGNEHGIYIRRKDKNSEEKILLDVNELAKNKDFYQLANWSISPKENLIAYAEDTSGRRQYRIKFKDLENEEISSFFIENTSGDMAWSSDGKYLFYVIRDEETLLPYKLFRHEIGTSQDKDVAIYEEKDTTFYLSVGNTRSMEYIEINISSTTSSEVRLIKSDSPYMTPQIFLPREQDHLYSIDHDPASTRFLIESNWKALNFRLLETDLNNSSDKNKWKELIPHREQVLLQSVIPFPNHLIIMERENGLRKLKILHKESKAVKEINFNDPTYTAYLASNPEYYVDRFYFGYSSMRTPDSLFSVVLSNGRKRLLKQAEVKGVFSSSDYKVEREFITARDGTKVPVSIVYKKNKFKKNENPIFLYGYGSYGNSIDAGFSSSRLSLLDRGFIFAIAHVRGGQELGRSWYEEGKIFNKLNTFYDFIDVTKGLVNKGYGNKDRIYAGGGSAGGLLMGAIVNMEPNLYKGIISNVPFVDVITTMSDPSIPLTTGEYSEWGNPDIKEEFEYILQYSPYDNISEHEYPSILVTAGLWDSQVQYYEPAKYVAKLRDYNKGKNPILMKVNMTAGHSGVSGRFESLKELAMEYAFLLRLDSN